MPLIKQHPSQHSLAFNRHLCGWNAAFLLEVLTGKATLFASALPDPTPQKKPWVSYSVTHNGRRQIQEYELGGKRFDDFDNSRAVLVDVKDNYDFAFAADKMRSWGNGQQTFNAWANKQLGNALDNLAIAKRHGLSYEYLVDPRHLDDWKRVLNLAMQDGLVVKSW